MLTVDGVPLLGNSHIRGQAPEVCGCGGFGGPDDWGRQPRPPGGTTFGTAQWRGQWWRACRMGGRRGRAYAGSTCGWLVRLQGYSSACGKWWPLRPWRREGSVARAAGQRGGSAVAGRGVAGLTPGGCMHVAHLRAFASSDVPRTGWDEVGADHPWLRVTDGRQFAYGRRLLTRTKARADTAQELAHLCKR